MNQTNFLLKPLINKYTKLVKRAGKEVAADGGIGEELQTQLERSMLGASRYIMAANKMMGSMVNKA